LKYISLTKQNKTTMENVALSDSNDDLTDEITPSNQQSHTPQRTFAEQQQHVTNELQDAANTDVIKGKSYR